MTLQEQIAMVENTARMCKSAGTADAAAWTEIAQTLKNHEEAYKIVKELEADFREFAGLTVLQKGLKATSIAVGKAGRFLRMGQIFGITQ